VEKDLWQRAQRGIAPGGNGGMRWSSLQLGQARMKLGLFCMVADYIEFLAQSWIESIVVASRHPILQIPEGASLQRYLAGVRADRGLREGVHAGRLPRF